jgi:hypothetical protein
MASHTVPIESAAPEINAGRANLGGFVAISIVQFLPCSETESPAGKGPFQGSLGRRSVSGKERPQDGHVMHTDETEANI